MVWRLEDLAASIRLERSMRMRLKLKGREGLKESVAIYRTDSCEREGVTYQFASALALRASSVFSVPPW